MIPLFKVFMADEVTAHLQPVLTSGHLTQGVQVDEYENALQKWFNYPFILSVNSGTSGLTLALRLLDLSAGDEVLCTPLTCLASNFPVLANNLRIKWVDVDPFTCNMDLDDLESKITNTTKAVLVVHWGGNPVNMTRLNQIRDAYDIPIIEDCAHAFGAVYENKYIGKHGNISVFSTQAIKSLTTGDGGLIFLPDDELFDRARLLRWYGIDRTCKNEKTDFRMENNVQEWGYKFHMNDINATIGLANLPYIREHLAYARNCVRKYYDPVIDRLNSVSRIQEDCESESSYWLYTIKVADKEKFINYMKTQGILCSQVHKRNDGHECLKEFQSPLCQLDILETQIVCIPCGWWISEEQYRYIADKIKQWDSQSEWVIRHLNYTDKSYLKLLSQLTHCEYDEKCFVKNLSYIEEQNGEIYVITDTNNIIIAAAKLLVEFKFGASVGHLEDMVVDENWRGMGLGTLLINHVASVAKQYGCYKLVLSAKELMGDFYTRNGFTKEADSYTLRF